MSREFRIGSTDSLLVFAVHPDDETLAAGGLLQQAHATGATTRVIFVTDGENNPWPQRVLERRWRIGEADRRRFGALRRLEARRALEQLGVGTISIGSFNLPDQGLTTLAVTDPRPALEAIGSELAVCRPTVVVAPSLHDCHPDHSAFAILLELALRGGVSRCDSTPPFHWLRYRIHGRPTGGGRVAEFQPSVEQQVRKRRAIREYRSQLVFRNRFYQSFAARSERFEDLPDPAPADSMHPLRRVAYDGGEVLLSIRSRSILWSLQPKNLIVVGLDGESRPIGFRAAAEEGELRLPRLLVGRARCLFAKLEHRWSFFDPSGWKEIALADARAIATVESTPLRPAAQASLSSLPPTS